MAGLCVLFLTPLSLSIPYQEEEDPLEDLLDDQDEGKDSKQWAPQRKDNLAPSEAPGTKQEEAGELRPLIAAWETPYIHVSDKSRKAPLPVPGIPSTK